jgi:hypothetical protein
MKLISKILMVGLFMLFSTYSFGGEVYDHVTYWGYTEESVPIEWEADAVNSIDEVTKHEVELYHVEHKQVIVVGETTHPTQQMTLVFPRSGHYIAKVRSCHDVGDPPVYECSAWAESTNKEYASVWVEGSQTYEPKNWWVYRHISPPGGIEIE